MLQLKLPPTVTWQHFDAEIICGYCLGSALITWLATCKKQQWDEYLGQVSYGVFLGNMGHAGL
jgi:hypothetical protein